MAVHGHVFTELSSPSSPGQAGCKHHLRGSQGRPYSDIQSDQPPPAGNWALMGSTELTTFTLPLYHSHQGANRSKFQRTLEH